MSPQIKRFLRRPQVEELTGLSTSTLYDKMAKGEFPKAVKPTAYTLNYQAIKNFQNWEFKAAVKTHQKRL